MIVTHEDTSVVTNILESNSITVERHFVIAGIIIEPKMIETITRSLTFVSRVADVEHNCWFLIEELFKNDSHHFKYLRIVSSMFVLAIIDEKMVGTIIHENCVFVEANSIMYLLIGHKTKGKFNQLS